MAYQKKITESKNSNRPVDEIRFGACKVVVWENETKSGPMLNFTLARIYKDGDDWKESQSLGLSDLLPMAEAIREAYRRAAAGKE